MTTARKTQLRELGQQTLSTGAALATALTLAACNGPNGQPAPSTTTAASAPPATSSSESSQEATPGSTSQQPSTKSSTKPSAQAGAPCRADQLSIRPLESEPGQSQLGSGEIWLHLVNTDSLACTMDGYGDVNLLDRDHQPLGITRVHQPQDPPQRLTVQPGGSVWKYLAWTTDSPGGKSCVTHPWAIRVSPQAGQGWLSVDEGSTPLGDVCSDVTEGPFKASRPGGH